jgi:hypothetical protein
MSDNNLTLAPDPDDFVFRLETERDTWRLAAERWEASAKRWEELYNDLRRIVETHVKQATEVLP